MTADVSDRTVSDRPLATKRVVIAQISLCKGCCCGDTGRGKPDVPVDRMKHEWRTRGLSKVVQLTISGCLGPCDLVNVVRISGGGNDLWAGNFRTIEDYLELVDWAEESESTGRPAPFSRRMRECRFDPFHMIDRDSCQLDAQGERNSHTKGES